MATLFLRRSFFHAQIVILFPPPPGPAGHADGGKHCAVQAVCDLFTPTLRVEFGNLPIFLAGLFLGPASGVIVGGLADVLGATLSGVVYCPPPTLAAMFIGLLAGLLRRWVLAKPSFWKSWSLTLLADVLAKMLWTTYWLTVLYGTAFLPLLAVRVPLYLVVSLIEGFVVFRLVKSGPSGGSVSCSLCRRRSQVQVNE
ncbi:MAG: folate family ECF transporter S component [Evtepia sp.]